MHYGFPENSCTLHKYLSAHMLQARMKNQVLSMLAVGKGCVVTWTFGSQLTAGRRFGFGHVVYHNRGYKKSQIDKSQGHGAQLENYMVYKE